MVTKELLIILVCICITSSVAIPYRSDKAQCRQYKYHVLQLHKTKTCTLALLFQGGKMLLMQNKENRNNSLSTLKKRKKENEI